MRFPGKFRRQVWLVRTMHPRTGRIAALRHEARDDAVEHDTVVKAVIGQLDNAGDMLRREVGPQLDRHVARGERQGQGFRGIGHGGKLR